MHSCIVSRSREFKLQELADAAEVSARTVRYYVQRGLLPAPVFRGKDSTYGEEHLLRLRAIKRLQAEYLPLDAIEAALARADEAALRTLAEGAPRSPPGKPAPRTPVPVEGGHPYRQQPAAHAHELRPPPKRAKVWVLAEGLTLSLMDDAPPESEALVRELLNGTDGRGGRR
jgi:DNA-binding transcriptional MerR regulator